MFPRRYAGLSKRFAGTIPFMHVLGSTVLALTLTELLNATYMSRKTVEARDVALIDGVLIDVSAYEQPTDMVPLAGRALTASLYGVKYVCVLQDDGDEGMEHAARNAVLRVNPRALVMSSGDQIAYPGRDFTIRSGHRWSAVVHVNQLADVLAEHQRYSGWLTVGPRNMIDAKVLMAWNISKTFTPWKQGPATPRQVVTDDDAALFLRLKQ